MRKKTPRTKQAWSLSVVPVSLLASRGTFFFFFYQLFSKWEFFNNSRNIFKWGQVLPHPIFLLSVSDIFKEVKSFTGCLFCDTTRKQEDTELGKAVSVSRGSV